MNVITPTEGVDPRTALATSIHAAPGVYAVLVGSGVSSGAGVPTGWQVLQDLIRRIALAEGVDEAELGGRPDLWWSARSGREPRYDELVAALAETDAARQSLLRGYFDPPASVGGPIEPTPGLRALATRCASGHIRVILTTNFDRLLERALDDAGASAQVIATPEGVEGMTPLAHASTTVLKLHGDYAGAMRNSPEELAVYPEPLRELVGRIIDEYGLIVVGWSAQYDEALAGVISSVPSRRYPTYWTIHDRGLGEQAVRLIAQRQASTIDTAGADEFFADLAERVGRLAQQATRRRRSTPLRSHVLGPDNGSAPAGWSVLPLLQLRAAAAIGPATYEDCGLIRAEHREALVAGLESSDLTRRLRALSSAPAASALATGGAPMPEPGSFEGWIPTPGGHQSGEHASYRLGGGGSAGVSTLVTISLPSLAGGGAIVIKVDIGLSLEGPISLARAALLWREGLLLAADALPGILGEVLPAYAVPDIAEVHALAASTDGNGLSRPNDLAARLDLGPLGTSSGHRGPSMGFAMRLAGPLSEHQAGEFAIEAVDHMALAHGYIDARQGIAALRSELDLAGGEGR